MIANVSIKNIALIRELSLDLKKGLNILSGETGAGKSIIIDSINFVLGDRADRSLIRYGETTARVEVVFTDIKNAEEVRRILQEADIDGEDDCIIVSRTMTADRSECRINRKIVNLSLLRTVVGLLVDTHSQNEHQSLLKVSNQIKILDAFDPKIEKILTNYQKCLYDYNKICDNLSQYPLLEAREREIEVLTYQIEEIEKVSPEDGEEDDLKAKRSRFYNAQKIQSSLRGAYERLSGDSGFSADSSIRSALSELRTAFPYDDSLTSLADRLESAYLEVRDVAETVLDKAQGDDLTSEDVSRLEARLEEIRLIKKKYGKSLEDVRAFYQTAKERLDYLTNAESEIQSLTQQKESLFATVKKSAIDLHKARVAASEVFCARIADNLVQLGMKNAVFSVAFTFDPDNIEDNLTQYGAETLEFMLSPNLGEPQKPLAKIASGGETSRFMLAIKTVIAAIDNVDTLIFDEIDTGISGVIAKVVAEKLYDISRNGQVIAITHLPQLASMGDVNYLIEKRIIGDKTLTFLHELSEEEVLREIMRLSGAVEQSMIGLSNARELKEQANRYKRRKA